MFRFFSFLSAIIICSVSRASELKCDDGLYLVRAHFRSGYTKSDRTRVASANVKTYYRKRSAVFDFWHSRIKDGRPDGWYAPNPSSHAVGMVVLYDKAFAK